jgi:hypothetical protein
MIRCIDNMLHQLFFIINLHFNSAFVSSNQKTRRQLKCPDGGMVDTQDLKSCGHNGCAGSSPAPGTMKPSYIILYEGFAFL